METQAQESFTIQQISVESNDLRPIDDDENDESEAEDGGLDWTKLLPPAARPIIPKRGEKEFEPRARGPLGEDGASTSFTGTALQQHILGRAREAMFDALRVTRTISSKNISYGVWYPNLARTHVTVARGTHFSSVGHSAPRANTEAGQADNVNKLQKRLELLPEEAIYLVERGSMLCWKAFPSDFPGPNAMPTMHGDPVPGVPMSVQQVYAEMMGREGLTVEKLQVYTYLKRLGYVVMRTEPPEPYYPVPPPFIDVDAPRSILERLFLRFRQLITSLVRFVTTSGPCDWWHPVRLGGWFHRNQNSRSILQSLRFIPCGHKVPLRQFHSPKGDVADTPYKIFYNVYKPNTPFKKSAPGRPDFQVVVVDARTTYMPSLYELTSLFDHVPEALPPAPRRKAFGVNMTQEKGLKKASLPSSAPVPPRSKWLPLFLQTWLFSQNPPNAKAVPKQNPFASLKMGKKIVIVAVVDSGNISFFRFGQGEFEQWPMI
ncbi:hypothetical protein APHAL10511_008351 [Amanita phalloides]|nr:hypothetical protein APHAL10511_008351 [Amanita phalloides]